MIIASNCRIWLNNSKPPDMHLFQNQLTLTDCLPLMQMMIYGRTQDLMETKMVWYPWLSCDDICKGIKALHELDHCLEEEDCLKHERAAMQLWMHEEWQLMQTALSVTGVFPFDNISHNS